MYLSVHLKHGNSVQNYNEKEEENLILIYVGQFLFAFHHKTKMLPELNFLLKIFSCYGYIKFNYILFSFGVVCSIMNLYKHK